MDIIDNLSDEDFKGAIVITACIMSVFIVVCFLFFGLPYLIWG